MIDIRQELKKHGIGIMDFCKRNNISSRSFHQNTINQPVIVDIIIALSKETGLDVNEILEIQNSDKEWLALSKFDLESSIKKLEVIARTYGKDVSDLKKPLLKQIENINKLLNE